MEKSYILKDYIFTDLFWSVSFLHLDNIEALPNLHKITILVRRITQTSFTRPYFHLHLILSFGIIKHMSKTASCWWVTGCEAFNGVLKKHSFNDSDIQQFI